MSGAEAASLWAVEVFSFFYSWCIPNPLVHRNFCTPYYTGKEAMSGTLLMQVNIIANFNVLRRDAAQANRAYAISASYYFWYTHLFILQLHFNLSHASFDQLFGDKNFTAFRAFKYIGEKAMAQIVEIYFFRYQLLLAFEAYDNLVI